MKSVHKGIKIEQLDIKENRSAAKLKTEELELVMKKFSAEELLNGTPEAEKKK